MKYSHFLKILESQKISVGPCVSIRDSDGIHIELGPIEQKLDRSRFVVMPVKIFNNKTNHLNVLLLDNKTKSVERYEPSSRSFRDTQIDELIETALCNMRHRGLIYFIQYSVSTWAINIVKESDTCVEWCVKYLLHKTTD